MSDEKRTASSSPAATSRQIDTVVLSKSEDALVAERARQLRESPVLPTLDNGQYQAIHWALFKELTPWAGRFRRAPSDLSGPDANANAAPSVAQQGRALFEQMRENGLGTRQRPMPKEELVNKASHAYVSLLRWRPFALGNMTTADVFIEQVAHEEGYAFNLQPGDASRRQTALAVAMLHDEPTLLRSAFRDLLRPYRAIAFEQSILTGRYAQADREFPELEEPFHLVRQVVGGLPGEAGTPLTLSLEGKTAFRRILTELNTGRLVEADSPKKANWFLAKDMQLER